MMTTMLMSFTAGLFALGGCHKAELDSVAIVGGSEEQRRAVRDEIEAFQRWAGKGRFSLRKVRFRELDDFYGLYSGNRIDINVAITSESFVRLVMRHELCHALDDVEEISSQGLFDAIVSGDQWDVRGRNAARREGFAQIYELGPDAAWSLSRECSGEPDKIARLGQALVDKVWSSTEPWPPARVAYQVSLSLPQSALTPAWNNLDVGVSKDIVRFGLLNEEERLFFNADLTTGTLVPEEDIPARQTFRFTDTIDQDDLPVIAGFLRAWDSELVIGRWRLAVGSLGDVERLVLLDNGRWIPLDDGCTLSSAGINRMPFAVDGQWLAELRSDGTLWWGRVQVD
ncbi:MAG: hypothetical protein AAGA48_36745 [Myxococcota bacterium]